LSAVEADGESCRHDIGDSPSFDAVATLFAGVQLGSMQPSSNADRGVCLGVVLGILLVTLSWAAYTHHVWEDFFITYRASRNLALGHGLVFTVGERIQTFTSPLQALIPAAIAWLTNCRSDELVIWIYRVTGGCALGVCGVILWMLSRSCHWSAAATIAALGLFAFDAKTIDFTANGMETPYLLFFMAWQAFVVITDGRVLWLGVAWAGMMMSRPDAFIQIAAFNAAAIVFSGDKQSAKRLAARALGAGALAAILYMPWLLWSTW
jgi:hypothetical protein